MTLFQSVQVLLGLGVYYGLLVFLPVVLLGTALGVVGGVIASFIACYAQCMSAAVAGMYGSEIAVDLAQISAPIMQQWMFWGALLGCVGGVYRCYRAYQRYFQELEGKFRAQLRLAMFSEDLLMYAIAAALIVSMLLDVYNERGCRHNDPRNCRYSAMITITAGNGMGYPFGACGEQRMLDEITCARQGPVFR